MVRFEIDTTVEASLETCFDLARSLSAHVESTSQTGERILERPDYDLLQLGDVVTFEARHFGIRQKLTSKIAELDFPNSFRDEMLEGAFTSFTHDHQFTVIGTNRTKMVDIVEFRAPLGLIGKLVEIIVLRYYVRKFITDRAESLKKMAENGNW